MTAPSATRAEVQDFVSQTVFALVGASRTGKGFGSSLLKELLSKGRRVLPVHPEAAQVGGLPAVRRLADLAEPVGGLIVVVPPTEAVGVVRDAIAAGIRRIWLQQGAESDEAVRLARQAGVSVVAGHCLLMFAEPVDWWGHRLHHWVLKIGRKLPD